MARRDSFAMYLRKSRADLEAEQRGEGETLARHRDALLETARRQGLAVSQIYQEIVSAEGIASRPVMQELLRDVEAGAWKGVLVMELERLARGDTMDQGLVAQAFKYSNTLIVTPQKTYDPTDEFDEEYVEFGLFMSRREYKTINRRMNAGRMASVNAGKWVASQAPYGYMKRKLLREQGFSLEIVPEEAAVVRQIFDWYTKGDRRPNGSTVRIGHYKIAAKLDEQGVPTPKGIGSWSRQSIRKMLVNPVYAGLIRWRYRATVKQRKNGSVMISHPINEEPTLVEGLHEAIVNRETWELTQRMIAQQSRPAATGIGRALTNPLAGLVVCGRCGRKMQRNQRPDGQKSIIQCNNRSCNNKAALQPVLEAAILRELRRVELDTEWSLADRTPEGRNSIEERKKEIERLESSLLILSQQIAAAHDLLERGVYSTEVFLQRSQLLAARRSEAEERLLQLRGELETERKREANRSNLLPKIKNILEVYEKIPTAEERNVLLREILDQVILVKDKAGKRYTEDFTMHLVLKAY